MSKYKIQHLFHVVDETGKRTKCGLPNQHKDAISQERFDTKVNDESLIKFCCKKCQQSNK